MSLKRLQFSGVASVLPERGLEHAIEQQLGLSRIVVERILFNRESSCIDWFVPDLHTAERLRYEKMGTNGRRREFIAGRMAAAVALRRWWHRCDRYEVISDNGCPYVQPATAQPPGLSISHDGSCAVGVCADRPVGVDLCRTTSRLKRVSAKLLNECDRFGMLEHELGSSLSALAVLWAAKEAVGKIDGRGVAVFSTVSVTHVSWLGEWTALTLQDSVGARIEFDCLVLGFHEAYMAVAAQRSGNRR